MQLIVFYLALLGPLVTLGAPLELPRPYYDAKADRVMCHVAPVAGPRLWQVIEMSQITLFAVNSLHSLFLLRLVAVL
jgi:hypothetical protein